MMTNQFTPDTGKQAGDLIQSGEWNAAMQEIVRLDSAKINKYDPLTTTGTLTVEGEIIMREGEENLFALGALDHLKIVAGHIDSDGTKLSGLGFNSNPIETGKYEITFETHFSDTPVVLGSPKQGSPSLTGNCYTVEIYDNDQSGFKVAISYIPEIVISIEYLPCNYPFSFIALGFR